MKLDNIRAMKPEERAKAAKDAQALLYALLGEDEKAKDNEIIWVRHNPSGRVNPCTRGIYRTSLRGPNFEADEFEALTPAECETEEQKVAMAKFHRDERAVSVLKRRIAKQEKDPDIPPEDVAFLYAELERRELALMEQRDRLGMKDKPQKRSRKSEPEEAGVS